MSALLKTLFPCLPLTLGPAEGRIRLPITTTTPSIYHPISEKPSLPPHGSKKLPKPTASSEAAISSATDSIISALLSASTPSPSLDLEIRSHVHQAGGWSEYFATKILSALETVLQAGEKLKMNEAMSGAYAKAVEAAECFEGFVKEHPVAVGVFCTVVALGVLVELVPEVVAWLGFEEVGILEGSWAARWQATYMGYVPKGSLFSFFQRMGMTKWRWLGGIVSEKQGLL